MPRIAVRAYDQSHRDALLAGRSGTEVAAVLDTDVNVPTSDLLSYALFREQKDYPGWRNYHELARRAALRVAHFEEYFDTSGNELRSRFPRGDDPDRALTEAIGVGVGLTVVSAIHGLTQADWEKIPISTSKDLDFEIASTGGYMVEVEAKGSIVTPSEIRSEISSHAASIKAKKDSQRASGNTNVLYGTIAAVPSATTEPTICYMLDPPAHDSQLDPSVHRLLARMSFYYRELAIFSRAHFLVALRNRIAEIARLNSHELDGLPLLRADGKPFDAPVSLWRQHSCVEDFAFGRLYAVGNGKAFFRGVRNDVIEPLLSQTRSAIDTLRFDSLDERKVQISARLSKRAAERLDVLSRSHQLQADVELWETKLDAVVNQDSAGRVFGWAYI